MRRRCISKSNLMVAALSALLLAALSVPLNAQPAVQTRPAHGFGPVYDAAHETTLEGTIERVQTRHVIGSPAGVHIFIAGTEGLVDAHLGSFLSKQTRDSLLTGQPVHVLGSMTTIRGKSYLLARQLTIGSRTISVRSQHGVLIPETSTNAKTRSRQTAQTRFAGGAQ